MEWGCHLDGRLWQTLHESLEAFGAVVPPNLRLQIHCIIEEGAVFFDFAQPDPSRRGWYAFSTAAAYDYKVVEQLKLVEMANATGREFEFRIHRAEN